MTGPAQIRTTVHRGIFASIFVTALYACTLCGALPALAQGDAFAPLERRLIEDGFPPERVATLYAPNSEPLLKSVTSMFRIQESKLNYGRFLEPGPISQAQKFMGQYGSILARAEKTYGVHRSVISAILLVETGFGQNTGKSPVLDVFSTFALMSEKSYRDVIWNMLPYEQRQEWGCYLFDRRLIKRADWAYGELRALLQYTETRPETIKSLRGSYMGAVGWPQFLPSSIVQYGVDGNGDGRVDLFDSTDAIMSAANYLQAHGWYEGATRAEQEAVIHEYNHSQPYVDTVLGVADILRQ